jgi:hypothetical protein
MSNFSLLHYTRKERLIASMDKAETIAYFGSGSNLLFNLKMLC